MGTHGLHFRGTHPSPNTHKRAPDNSSAESLVLPLQPPQRFPPPLTLFAAAASLCPRPCSQGNACTNWLRWYASWAIPGLGEWQHGIPPLGWWRAGRRQYELLRTRRRC